jgi:hypothetical protein
MNAEQFEKEFLSLPEAEQMSALRKILAVLCRTMKEDPKKVLEMISLLSEECGNPAANMISMMGMMGRKGGGCCGSVRP